MWTAMNKSTMLAIMLVAIGLGSLAVGLAYTAYLATSYANQQGIMGQWFPSTQSQSNPPITLEQARRIAEQYLASKQNPNLAIKEIMEFQNNFYVPYYEKDTGIGAFEMLIWKQAPDSGMMGGMMGMNDRIMTGVIMPEPGPNMMWNTKYGMMNGGMMGQGMMGDRNQVSSPITITGDEALQIAQTYLDANLKGAKVEDPTQFLGYYTVDFTVNGKIAGMVSVNGYTGQVWYHSWHGIFIQEIEFD